MSIIYLLVPLAAVLAGIAVVAFVWSARRGQLDDLVTPALRMLHDDDEQPKRAAASAAPAGNTAAPAGNTAAPAGNTGQAKP